MSSDVKFRSIPDSVYMDRGNQLVAETFDTLRSSLLSAIGSEGMDGAIEFCNEQAYVLTGILGDSVVIRRTSLLFRNPGNKPDSLERIVLDEMSDTQTPQPKLVHRQNGEVHFFKPILLQAMCLNCHGAPGTEIQPATRNAISQHYPNDSAINFKVGDLRGAWHIIFNPETKKERKE